MPSFLPFGYVFNPDFLNALGFVCLIVYAYVWHFFIWTK